MIELRCNECHEVFAEEDAVEDEFCPYCGSSNLFEREADDAPWCQYCGAKRERFCQCGPIAENN